MYRFTQRHSQCEGINLLISAHPFIEKKWGTLSTHASLLAEVIGSPFAISPWTETNIAFVPQFRVPES
jgi:hypothetical protein